MPLPRTPTARRLLVIAAMVCGIALLPIALRLLPEPQGVVIDVPADAVAAAEAPEPEPALTQPSGSTAAPGSGSVTVHVVGPVRRPGVVSLPIGSRVADAVAACGGTTGAAASSVNLARVLQDGERIDLAAPDPSGTATGPTGAPPGKLDLNTATAEQLEELPGVGPAMAARIIERRTQQGPFTDVQQLQEVPGIGERRLADLIDLVTAGPS